MMAKGMTLQDVIKEIQNDNKKFLNAEIEKIKKELKNV